MIKKRNMRFSSKFENTSGMKTVFCLVILFLLCMTANPLSKAEEVKGYWYLIDVEKVVPEDEVIEDSTTKIERKFLYSEGSFSMQYKKTVYDGIHKVYNDEIINTSGTWSTPSEKIGPEDNLMLTLTAGIDEFKRLNTNMSGINVKAYIGESNTPFGRLNSTVGDLVDDKGENLCEAIIRDGEIKVDFASKTVEGTFGKGTAEGQIKVLFVSVRTDKLGGTKYVYQWSLEKPVVTSSGNDDKSPMKVSGTLYFDNDRNKPVPFTSVRAVFLNKKNEVFEESEIVFTDHSGKFAININEVPDKAVNLRLVIEYIYAPSGIATIYHTDVRADDKHPYMTMSIEENSCDEKPIVFDLCLLDCLGINKTGYVSDLNDEETNEEKLDVKNNVLVYELLLDMYGFYKNEMGVSSFYDLPFESFSFGGTFISSLLMKFDAYYNPNNGNIWLDRIYSPLRGYMYPYAYYHEFSHYIMHCLYNKFPLSATDINHGGYANPTTGDSFSEGFAHFMAIYMQHYFNDDNPKVIPGRGNIEVNYKAWQQSGKAEEFAVAGVLWDLMDDASDNGGRDDDDMELDFMDLWKLLRQYHSDFTSFYELLINTYPDQKSSIDEIFINHGFFTDSRTGSKEYEFGEAYLDLNRNGVLDSSEPYIDYSNNDSFGYPYMEYNVGDKTGAAAYFSNLKRRSQEFFPGNFIKVNNDILIYSVSVTFRDYPYLDYATMTCNADGFVYVEVPPREYPCTITVTPYDGNKKNALVFDSDDFWMKYDASLEQGYYLLHDFEIGSENNKTHLLIAGFCVLALLGIILFVAKKRKL